MRIRTGNESRSGRAGKSEDVDKFWEDFRVWCGNDGIGKGKIAVAGNFSKLGKVVCAAGLGGKGKKNFLLRV